MEFIHPNYFVENLQISLLAKEIKGLEGIVCALGQRPSRYGEEERSY